MTMSETKEPRAFRVHVGVHKTASTHLQRTLEAQTEHLRQQGIDVLTPDQISAHIAAYRPGRLDRLSLRLRGSLPGGVRRREAARFAAALRPLWTGAPEALLSAEHFVGKPSAALLDPMYRFLHRLEIAHEMVGDRPLEVYVAIRSLDGFLPSAYAEALRWPFEQRQRFETLAARARANPPSWLGVIDRLRRAAPRARLRVWTYDDYRRDARALCSALVGRDLAPMEELPRPAETATPSAEAVRQVEAMGLPETSARIPIVARIFKENPATADCLPFNPLSPEDRARLRARFEADLAELDRRHPGMRLRLPG